MCDHVRTLMIAGHDTTAATIAWVIERIVHHPAVLAELEATVGSGDDTYLDAVIHETLRVRPVFPFTLRLTKRRLKLEGLTVEPETIIVPHVTLVHRRPEIYPNPHAFRPERFLGTRPGTYSWIPFGGGMRRCIGASMSLLEARVVIRTLIQELDLRAERTPDEAIARRVVVIVPKRGAQVSTRVG
jgi:cytochrome P450 family 135